MKKIIKGQCLLCLKYIHTTALKNHLAKHINGKTNVCLLKISSENVNNKYWFYVIIKENETLASLETVIKKAWFINCSHEGYFYTNNKTDISTDTPISENIYIEYIFDKINPTKLTIFLCDKFKSDKNLVLVARNLPPKYLCNCGTEAKIICTTCKIHCCSVCFGKHKECKSSPFYITNSPRINMCLACPIKKKKNENDASNTDWFEVLW